MDGVKLCIFLTKDFCNFPSQYPIYRTGRCVYSVKVRSEIAENHYGKTFLVSFGCDMLRNCGTGAV